MLVDKLIIVCFLVARIPSGVSSGGLELAKLLFARSGADESDGRVTPGFVSSCSEMLEFAMLLCERSGRTISG